MSKSVDFYFDFGSPSTYLAWTQLPKICAETGATLVYKPILLGGIFQASGNSSPVTVPAKGIYTLKDFARFAKRYGVTLNHNPHFPINTLPLMRMVTGIQLTQPERFDDFVKVIFEAFWVERLNMGDPEVLANVLSAGGFDPAALLALSNTPEVKEQLKNATADAVAKGLFGAPSFIVAGELYFGQDRLDFVREALSA